jgi:type I restriction enzyme S subunit
MAKQTLPKGWKHPKSRDVFASVTDKSHNGRLQVLSATQDRGIVPRTAMDIDIKFDENALPTYKRVVPGNFVIHLRSFQGGLAYSDIEGVISPAYVILEPKVQIEDDYYKYLFQSTDYIKRLNVAVYGIRDGKQISYESFGMINIPLPPLAEQRSIAEILTTADRLISVKERLIAAKRKQKRWLMSQLFTGKLRLPGFSGAWETVRFSSLFKGHSTISNGSEQYPLYSLTLENGVTPKTERYERSHLVLKGEQYKVVFPNDYVYNPMNITLGAVFRHTRSFPVTVSGYYDVFALNDVTEVGFFDNYLTSPTMLKHYDRVATGSVKEKQRVHFSQFIEFNLPLPKAEERQAIAAVLIAADREIELLTRELEQQRQIKKHLMQQLLTGRIRTKGATI